MFPIPFTVIAMSPGPATNTPAAGAAAKHLEIEVAYANGKPSAPDGAVLAGGTVTWRTAPGERAPFQILSRGAWVDGRHDIGLSSQLQDGRQALQVRATGSPGAYHYAIEANGEVVDPDVIIVPR